MINFTEIILSDLSLISYQIIITIGQKGFVMME